MNETTTKTGPRIYLSVAEASADMHAAALIQVVRRRLPGAIFEGLTGPRTRAAGALTTFDMAAHAAMLTGMLKVIGKGMAASNATLRRWGESRPDLLLLVDSPELNLPLAAQAHRQGIPVLYYVAPQTWASREYRVRRIRRDIDRLACILPFEENYFRKFGVRASYVGHPLFESLRNDRADEGRVSLLRSDRAAPLIAILPGSRKHVVESMLPLQLAVIGELRRLGVPHRIAISVADAQRLAFIEREIARCGMASRVVSGQSPVEPVAPADDCLLLNDNASLLTAADLVLVASGTATLHVAAYRKPMIVMYDAGALLRRAHRLFGKWILHTPHLSLVNILANRRLVPEFMPAVPPPVQVARVARDLLRDNDWRLQMVTDLDRLIRPLEETNASERVSEMIQELCGLK